VFSKDQLESYKEDSIFSDHCFINCMKNYKIDDDIIEFARDIIKYILSLKYLDKICRELTISYEVSFVDDSSNQHTAKKYGNVNTHMK
jgi:hypothetical protein